MGIATIGAPTRRTRRLRALGFAALSAAIVAAVVGLASASLTANGSGTGHAYTSNVALTLATPASATCTYSALVPGDLTGASTCNFGTVYSGIPAYESLTISVRSKAGVGGTTLYNPDAADPTRPGLVLSLTDDHGTSFTLPAGAGTTGGSCPATYTCWTTSYDLASSYDSGGGNAPPVFQDGDTATYSLKPAFAKANGNAYQGATATVTLTAQAVQVTANTIPSICSVGSPCPSSSNFSWS